MKNQLFYCFISLFMINTAAAQIQSGSAVYKVQVDEEAVAWKLNSENKDGLAPIYHDLFKKSVERERKMLPHLRFQSSFNKEESLFQAENLMMNDNGLDLERARGAVGFRGDFYVNLKDRKILNDIHYLDKHWLVERSLDELKWEITTDTKIIQGYVCKKATATYATNFSSTNELKITAWFAPDIPFQFGPMYYAGLPGLILQLNQNYFTFYIDTLDLSKDKRKIAAPKGEHYSYEEFEKEKKRVEYQAKMRHVEQRRGGTE